jgi:hypothetical protein
LPDSLDDYVLVERHLFGIMDLDGSPTPWPQGSMPPDVMVHAQPNRIDVRSPSEDHVVAVRFQAWDGPPVPPEEGWEPLDEVRLALSSGQVRLWALTDGPSPNTFRAGPGAHMYQVMVYTRGQDEALVLHQEGAEIPDGTEKYLLQFRQLGPWTAAP